MTAEMAISATVSCGVNSRPYGTPSQRGARGRVPPGHDAGNFGNCTRNNAARIEARTCGQALLGISGAQILRRVSIHGVPQRGKGQSIQDCHATRKAHWGPWVKTQRAAIQNLIGLCRFDIDCEYYFLADQAGVIFIERVNVRTINCRLSRERLPTDKTDQVPGGYEVSQSDTRALFEHSSQRAL
jgi:hypothetical protein